MTTILNWRSGAVRACLSTGGGVAAIALIVAGCGGASGGQHASAHGAQGSTKAASSADVSRATPSADSSGVASIELADSKLGKILVDGTGDTLYLFQADRGAIEYVHRSVCNRMASAAHKWEANCWAWSVGFEARDSQAQRWRDRGHLQWTPAVHLRW